MNVTKLLILDLDVHFIIHIKQVLTKKKSGRYVSLSKIRGEAAASDSQGMLRRAHRSKLKIHIEILSSLACFGPMKLHGLMTKIGLDKAGMKEHLELLADRGLVESQNLCEKTTFYVLTERGIKVLKVMSSINNEACRFQALQF